ncbi:hypothetical protein ABEB36_013123, partial [Hypothenemus hampei]
DRINSRTLNIPPQAFIEYSFVINSRLMQAKEDLINYADSTSIKGYLTEASLRDPS